MAYPSGIKIYIDGKDCTYTVFNREKLDPTTTENTWRDVDISNYLRRTPGLHTVRITCASGAGRVEARVEVR